MDQLPWLGKRELICLLLFTCNYLVSVRRGFLFGCLGWATLYYCGTPRAFHIIILLFQSVCFLHLILFSYMSHIMKKPFTRVSVQVRQKSACKTTENCQRKRIYYLLETAVFLLNILLFRDFTFIFLFESKLPAEDIDNIL